METEPIPVDRQSACRCCRHTPGRMWIQSNMRGQEITQPVWWQLFCHRQANAVEQLRQPEISVGQFERSMKTFMFG